jgi:hypothetical protein
MQTFPLELVSEWAKIKKSIQENFVKKLKSDDNEKIKKSLGLKIDSNLNIRNHNNKKWISIKFDLRVTKYVFI